MSNERALTANPNRAMNSVRKLPWFAQAVGIAVIAVLALVTVDFVGGVWIRPDVGSEKNLGPIRRIVVAPYPKATVDAFRADSGWYYVQHAWFTVKPGQELLLVTDKSGSRWLCHTDMARCARVVMHCAGERQGQPTDCRAEPAGEFSFVAWFQRALRPYLAWTLLFSRISVPLLVPGQVLYEGMSGSTSSSVTPMRLNRRYEEYRKLTDSALGAQG